MTRLDFFRVRIVEPEGGAWGGTVSRITIGQNVHVPSTDETTKRKLYTRVRLMGIPRGVIRRTDGRTDLCDRPVGRSVHSPRSRSVGRSVGRVVRLQVGGGSPVIPRTRFASWRPLR